MSLGLEKESSPKVDLGWKRLKLIRSVDALSNLLCARHLCWALGQGYSSEWDSQGPCVPQPPLVTGMLVAIVVSGVAWCMEAILSYERRTEFLAGFCHRLAL